MSGAQAIVEDDTTPHRLYIVRHNNCGSGQNKSSCNFSYVNRSLPTENPMLQRWTPKPTIDKRAKPVSIDIWYDRMGGSSTKSIEKLQKRGAKEIQFSTHELSSEKKMQQVKANMKAKPHSGQIPRVVTPGYKFWGDSQGPNVKSFLEHHVYVFGWLCDATNFGFVTFHRNRSEAYSSFLALQARSPHQIRQVVTDGAKEYFSNDMKEKALDFKIEWHESPAYVSQRNPRIEHWWYRTDLLTRYMLSRCGGWKIFWAYAKELAVLIVNVKTYGPTDNVPYEDFYKMKFDYGKLRVFGCTVVIRYLSDVGRGNNLKYNDKTQWGFYLGFDETKWMHKCYGLETGRVHMLADQDIESFEENFGAMHNFMGKNPSLNVLSSVEFEEFVASSQGENASESSLKPNPFGISKASEELWAKTSHDINVDKVLPGKTSKKRIPKQGESSQEKEKDQGGSTSIQNQDLPVEVPQPQEAPKEQGLPVEVPEPMEIENSPQEQVVSPPISNVMPEVVAQPDECLEQERIVIQPMVERRVTRSDVKTKAVDLYKAHIPTSSAKFEVRQLAKQNEKMQMRANFAMLTTIVEEDKEPCVLNVEYEMERAELMNDISENENSKPIVQSTMFAMAVMAGMCNVEETQKEIWQNHCEQAMHLFMIEGMQNGGYYEDFYIQDRKRKRKRSEPLGYAMPTMDGPEPQTLEEARTWTDGPKYVEAADKEMIGHKENVTWTPSELARGAKAISTRMVFVRKINPDNTLRYKARLVARGFTQVAGENFNWDTVFAPVLKMTSLRWLFSLIAEYDLEVTSSDVVQAFLQAKLKDENDSLEEIYIELPKGYETTCPTTGKILRYGRLLKAIYGLKQAPRRWAETLCKTLRDLGFRQHPHDACIYILVKQKSILIIGVYVDDMIKLTNDPSLRKKVDQILSTKLKIEHQGECKEFLGLQLGWKTDSQGRRYFNVSQEKYCRKIMDRFGMKDCASKDSPTNATGKPEDVYMWPNPEPADKCCKKRLERYRAGIGALIYLTTMTRPDIAYAVNAVSQFMANPTEQHEVALWRIFRYLKDREHYSLKYYKSSDLDPKKSGMSLDVFVDANFMGDHDSRSVTGQISMSGNGILNWGAKRQPTIATSTPHAECNAFYSAVKELVHVRNIIGGFKMECSDTIIRKPTIINCDNEAAVEITGKRSENTSRTKHWPMQWNWLHEQREVYKTYLPLFVRGKENPADLFTKPMAGPLHSSIVKRLRLGDV